MARPKHIILLERSYVDLADQYQEHLLRIGYHPKSSRSKYHYICEFLHYLAQNGVVDISKVSPQQINAYYDYLSSRPSLQDGSTLSQKTTHSHLRNVRDLFKMLVAQGKLPSNPCSTLSFPYPKQKRERIILTQAEINQLYEACDTTQERALLSLAYGCGLRVGELEKCDIKDVRLREKILIVPDGKGRKRRVVPMSKGVAKDLGNYFWYERDTLKMGRDFKLNASDNHYAFMLHSRGGRMRKWTYNKYLKAII